MYFSGIAYSSDEVVYKCQEQLLQKYPNVEAIKKQFGAEAKWQEETQPSIHDDTLELQIKNMEYPGIEIGTLGYAWEGEYRFFITLLGVKKAGFVTFLGLDVGSAREEAIKTFGGPQEIDGNELIYHDEAEYTYIIFTIEKNNVAEMKFVNYLD
jgi:hypothetical protein